MEGSDKERRAQEWDARRRANIASARDVATEGHAYASEVHAAFDEILGELTPRPSGGATVNDLAGLAEEIEALELQAAATRTELLALQARTFDEHVRAMEMAERTDVTPAERLAEMRAFAAQVESGRDARERLRALEDSLSSLQAMRDGLVELYVELRGGQR